MALLIALGFEFVKGFHVAAADIYGPPVSTTQVANLHVLFLQIFWGSDLTDTAAGLSFQ